MTKSIFFHTQTRASDGGYKHTKVRVVTATPTRLAARIAHCRTNKLGYQTQAVADAMGERMQYLAGLGYTHLVEPSYSYDPTFCIDWLHYDDAAGTYCEPGIDVGSRLLQIERNRKLLLRVLRQCAKLEGNTEELRRQNIDTPAHVIRALCALRAQPIEEVKLDGPAHTYLVYTAMGAHKTEAAGHEVRV